jgi:hypothetical protein
VPLEELARESAVGDRSRSIGSVLQDRFAEARRFTQTNAARDDSFINSLAKMFAHLRHDLLTKICPTVEHGHDNAAELESPVGARIPHLLN